MSRKKLETYVIPVGLTTFQKDLIEILISLHSYAFKSELFRLINSSDNASNSDDNEKVGIYPYVTEKQMTFILDNGIRAIGNHPCLLVHHYMPKQVLLLEPSDRLFSTSDKFQKMSSLLLNLMQRKKDSSLRIALVSHNIREVDILESFMLGKDIKLKRLVGTPLYDEHNVYRNHELDILERDDSNSSLSPVSNRSSSKDISDSNISNKNKANGRKRRRIIKKQSAIGFEDNKSDTNNIEKDDDWVFLTSTRHITNDPTILVKHDVNFIISCDPLLEENIPAIKLLEKNNSILSENTTIPFIKFLVKDSPDHYLIDHDLAELQHEEYENVIKSISHFLSSREEISTDNDIDFMKFVDYLLNKDIPNQNFELPKLKLTEKPNNDLSLEIVNGSLKPRLSLVDNDEKQNELLGTIEDDSIQDMNNYQLELTKRTIELMENIQDKVKKCKEIIFERRSAETERQNKIDELKKNSGISFKNFQDKEKTINESNKTFDYAKSTNLELLEELTTLKNRKYKLENLVSSNDTANAFEVITKSFKDNTIKRNKLYTELSDQEAGNENLRSEYQKISKEALDKVTLLEKLKKQAEQLKKDDTSSLGGIKYSSLSNETKFLKTQLSNLQEQVKFVEHYITRMEKIYLSSQDKNSGNSSSSDKSNQHNTSNKGLRHRSTRSNTTSYV